MLNLEPPKKDNLCPMIKRALAQYDDKDLATFMAAMDDERWTSTALAKALTDQGFKINEGQVWKHRAKRCACARA